MRRKKMVMRVRSAEKADAEEEVGVFDRRHEKKPPMVWGPPPAGGVSGLQLHSNRCVR